MIFHAKCINRRLLLACIKRPTRSHDLHAHKFRFRRLTLAVTQHPPCNAEYREPWGCNPLSAQHRSGRHLSGVSAARMLLSSLQGGIHGVPCQVPPRPVVLKSGSLVTPEPWMLIDGTPCGAYRQLTLVPRYSLGANPVQRTNARENALTSVYPNKKAVSEIVSLDCLKYLRLSACRVWLSKPR